MNCEDHHRNRSKKLIDQEVSQEGSCHNRSKGLRDRCMFKRELSIAQKARKNNALTRRRVDGCVRVL